MEVLVVDSNVKITYRLKSLLEGTGVSVIGATSINEALNKVYDPKNKIGIVIIEPYLGDGDGYYYIPKFKKANPELMVVILSGVHTRNDFVNSIKSGAVDFIIKPFDEIYLKQKLVRHIQDIKAAQSITIPSNDDVESIYFRAVRDAVREHYALLVGILKIHHEFPTDNPEAKKLDRILLNHLLQNIDTLLEKDEKGYLISDQEILLICPRKSTDLKDDKVNKIKDKCKEYIALKKVKDTFVSVAFLGVPSEVRPEQNALDILQEKLNEEIKKYNYNT